MILNIVGFLCIIVLGSFLVGIGIYSFLMREFFNGINGIVLSIIASTLGAVFLYIAFTNSPFHITIGH